MRLPHTSPKGVSDKKKRPPSVGRPQICRNKTKERFKRSFVLYLADVYSVFLAVALGAVGDLKREFVALAKRVELDSVKFVGVEEQVLLLPLDLNESETIPKAGDCSFCHMRCLLNCT